MSSRHHCQEVMTSSKRRSLFISLIFLLKFIKKKKDINKNLRLRLFFLQDRAWSLLE